MNKIEGQGQLMESSRVKSLVGDPTVVQLSGKDLNKVIKTQPSQKGVNENGMHSNDRS
jgi:hypothetical protein